ncbi:MAG: hypothetical protein ACRDID_08935 [Ktedonobacterales bacterium]
MNQPPPGPYDPYNVEPTTRMRATPPGASGSAPSNQSYPPTVPDQRAYRTGPARHPAGQPARMPRARALEVTRRFKTALIAGSVMAFGVLTALVAGHTTGVTARAASNASSGAPATSTPSNDDSGGFFNSAPSTSGNGGFGVSPSAPSQPPVSGSSVS